MQLQYIGQSHTLISLDGGEKVKVREGQIITVDDEKTAQYLLKNSFQEVKETPKTEKSAKGKSTL